MTILWNSRLSVQLVISAVSTLLFLSLFVVSSAPHVERINHSDDSFTAFHQGHRMTPPQYSATKTLASSRRRSRRQRRIIQEESVDSPTTTTVINIVHNVTRKPTFALIPKVITNPYFDVSGEGCVDAAERLGATCIYTGPLEYDPTGQLQVQILQELLLNATNDNGTKLDGLAVSSVNASSLTDVFQAAKDLNIPVVTFDSDAPNTVRQSYIGTDNYFFGKQLAKALARLEPNPPAYFAIVSSTDPNIVEREKGVRDFLIHEGWIEVESSPSDMKANSTLVVDQMFAFAERHPELTAIVPVMGAGMRAPDNYWNDFVNAHPDILLVVGDAMPNQLALLDRQFCQGLVGQLPYEMGALSIETLHGLYQDPSLHVDAFIGTNILEHLLIPLILPVQAVDHNLVGDLKYVGYALFALVAAMAFGFSIWTFAYRSFKVVQIAQPNALLMVALGVLIMCAAVIPMGLDGNFNQDEADQFWDVDDTLFEENESRGVAICMSPIWLLIVGFSICFSSLVYKIYRVTRLFDQGSQMRRVRSSERDALVPLFGLMIINCTILTTWNILDPLHLIQKNHEGLDGWGRPVSTYSICEAEGSSFPYILPLCLVNGGVLVVANWIAYRARSISEEFAESKYVFLAMASILQAVLSGIPILVVVYTQKSPQAFYMGSVFMIFIMCSAILLLIFVPRIVLFYEFKHQEEHVQRARIAQSIRKSTHRSAAERSHDDSSDKFQIDASAQFGGSVNKLFVESMPGSILMDASKDNQSGNPSINDPEFEAELDALKMECNRAYDMEDRSRVQTESKEDSLR